MKVNDSNARCTISSGDVSTITSTILMMLEGCETKNVGVDLAEVVRQFLNDHIGLSELDFSGHVQKAFWAELKAEHPEEF
jgi:hypothetical protein